VIFEDWWRKHTEKIEVLRKESNLEWIKPIFENCWISACETKRQPEDSAGGQPESTELPKGHRHFSSMRGNS